MHKKILISFLVLLLLFVFVAANFKYSNRASAYSNTDFQTAAKKYAESYEKTGKPITLRYNGEYFYYVPFETNKTISGTFPGLILDSTNKPVMDKTVLEELFRYPGLLLNFADSAVAFDKLATKKIAAFAKYCRILEVQEIKANEMNLQANVPGVLYQGIKLAFDAVSFAKTGITGSYNLILKELIKNKTQDTIISYFSSADSGAILESSQAAYNNSATANGACKSALSAWGASVSTSGKASPEAALSATEDTMRMFAQEAVFVEFVGQSLERVNNYPQVITKINQSKYTKAVSALNKLKENLKKEAQNWQQEKENANDDNALELWADEQILRINSVQKKQNPPSTPVAAITSCTPVDLSSDYKFYTYAPESNPCRNFANTAGTSAVNLSCTTGGQFRNHWVKKIKVTGLNKLNIKTSLGIDDSGFFSSMCPLGGVKYDDYSSLLVLSTDPTPIFDAECNKICAQADWGKCGINLNSDMDKLKGYVIGKCGVPKCSPFAQCNFDVNTAGLDYVYLVFHTSNPWPAYVTGSMADMEVCPEE